jgi:hypothetical protein
MRYRFSMRIFFLMVITLAFVSLTGGVESDTKSSATVHPWLADVPPHLRRLVELGQVHIQTDEAKVSAADRTALTEFQFQTVYHMRFFPARDGSPKDKKSTYRIGVRFTRFRSTLEHRISLSESYKPTKPWESPLLLHEFDHVAISSEPRIIAIFNCLEGASVTLEVPTEASGKPDREAHEQATKTYVHDFQREVERIVNEAYVELDERSNNGLQVLPDRKKFFLSLYTGDWLKEKQFSYIDQVTPAIQRIKPEAIQLHYGWR